MLVDIATGYEGRFDFESGRDPETSYLLATVPRSGSTWFSHLLWRTGCLGAPLEYLNFDPAGPYFFASHSAEVQHRLWQSVRRRRTSPNGVFGIKCFPMQLQALQEGNPTLLADVMAMIRTGKVICLERRDRIAHAVSYARATLSGVWRKEQEGRDTPEPTYSPEAVEAAQRWIEAQGDLWARMFDDLKIAPLRLYYEDALAQPDDSIRQVCDWLGIVLQPDAAVVVPSIEKQAEAPARGWIEAHTFRA